LVAPTSIAPISFSFGMFVHWTAAPPSQTVREIQQFHMGPSRGWTDIAYSWLVDQRGNIHEGRGWGRAGAHTAGYNSTFHAVCAIAGEDGQITEPMMDAIVEVVNEHDRRYGHGNHRPHRAVGATACPGDKLAGWVTAGGLLRPIDGGFTVAEMDTIAGWFHDTRRLILQGQIRAEEMHRQQMVAEWRTRKILRGEHEAASEQALSFATAEDTDAEVAQAHADSRFLVIEGQRQLAELDAIPVSDLPPVSTPV
jgi:hypothetical protein